MINLKKIGLMVLVIYWVLAVSFYFLAGDQLRYRESRGNLVMPDPEGGAVELIEGVLLEQHFTAAIQRLEAVSVMGNLLPAQRWNRHDGAVGRRWRRAAYSAGV